MKQIQSKTEEAVSPVVAVMLMLVVTIIIAAVVSAFAGGLTDSTQASPTSIIKGTYSQSGGLALTLVSGDPILGATVYVRPGTGFSASNQKHAWKALTISETSAWSPGEVKRVSADKIQPETDGAPDSGGYEPNTNQTKSHDGRNPSYGFNCEGYSYNSPTTNKDLTATSAVGKTMVAEIHKAGRVIASVPITISA